MSEKRPIATYSRAEYEALRKRLEAARDTLRVGGALLQSVARGYYVVYVVASYAAGKYGTEVTHRRSDEEVTEQRFSHYEFADVVWALYTGNKRGSVTNPGSSPGIISAYHNERQANRKAIDLAQLRIEADYGPSSAAEPYTAAEVDEYLKSAKYLTDDLENLL